MSAAARLAGGATYVIATVDVGVRERLTKMQAEMDWIAAGKLPIADQRGRAATASDVEAYLASRRQSVREVV